MLNRRTILIAALGLLALAPRAHAVAEAGAQSLLIPPGARANAMGESFVALSDDATAPWWNPAGLAFIGGNQISLMHSQLVPDLADDVYYEYLGYAGSFEGIGTVGISLVYLTYGKSVAVNEQGIEQGEFSSWELTPQISYGVRVPKILGGELGLGLGFKFIHVSLAPEDFTLEGVDGSGSSFAVDVGGLLRFEQLGLNLGLAVTNLGPDIAYIDEEQADPLPRSFRLGGSFYLVNNQNSHLLVTGDVNQMLVTFDRSPIYGGGAEYEYLDLIAVRAGYVYDQDGNIKDPTFGLGFNISKKFFLDYGNIPQAKELDRVNRFSVGVRF
jgi:hypothetical protein